MASPRKYKDSIKDIHQDLSGNYVYTGDLYSLAGDHDSVTKLRTSLILVLIVQILLVIMSGCIDAAGTTNAFYVILPFIGEVSAVFALSWTMVRLIAGGSKVRAYVLDNARNKVPGETKILAFFAILGAVMSLVFLIRNGIGDSVIKSVLYPLVKLATAGCALYYGKLFGSAEWVVSE